MTDPDGGSAMYIVAPYARDMSWASSWTSPRPERPVLGRLIALAKASANTVVGWLSGEGEGKKGEIPSSWEHAFRSGRTLRFSLMCLPAAQQYQVLNALGRCVEVRLAV